MRRILAAATLGLALFGAAACADTPVDNPGASAAPSAASSPAGVDKATACANLTKATDEFTAKFTALLPKLTDPAGQKEAATQLLADLTAFQTAYGKDAAAIADADLKAAVQADLATLGSGLAAVGQANGDVTKIQAALSTPEFSAAGEKVKTICGK
ncbi:hypothetical protein QEZ54_32135 [Catellatospora sp. KI3]|uniref:hypothetical protein n=1 Tax=Catellatospora sp. KI3 TaxID=3041620 RepID=UPI002482B0B3|nr:hypothetical protein [Catellatospora sp. KI3]MDI1465630.1 hypothetical protein [Catellatospora sp. KI3]